MTLQGRQYRVLYKQFLFGMADPELLASHGDPGRLAAQFAALLLAFGLTCSMPALRYYFSDQTAGQIALAAWPEQHFFISTTMLCTALFAVLSWEAMFPGRRDVYVLAPLPIRPATIFVARAAAVATGLGLAVLSLNLLTGLVYPPVWGSVTGSFRALGAYWLTVFAAGLFVYGSVLLPHGLAALCLPRRLFMTVSSILQLAAFGSALIVYFLEPALAFPKALLRPENQTMIEWLPSYWFFGLYHSLAGSGAIAARAINQLAWRAEIATGVALAGAGAVYLFSYLRTIRTVAEEPDIVPDRAARIHVPAPRFGSPTATAVVLFAGRGLVRSRQHRVILALYLGAGLAIALTWGKDLRRDHVMVASIVMLCFAVAGMRAAFAIPVELRANWVFRVTHAAAAGDLIPALRKTLLFLAVVPVCLLAAAVLWTAGFRDIVPGHFMVLGVVGATLIDLCLRRFQKIPFTCSWMPGKANVHVTSIAYLAILIWAAEVLVSRELRAGESLPAFARMMAWLVAFAAFIHWRTRRLAIGESTAPQFEEDPVREVWALELHRDGRI